MTGDNRQFAQRNWDICTSANDLDGSYFAIKKGANGAVIDALKDKNGNDLTALMGFINTEMVNGDIITGNFSVIEVSSGNLACAID